MMTFYDNDGAIALGVVVRMGAYGSVVDNASKGGLFCGIYDDGKLAKYAYNRRREHFACHPQGAVFDNCHIPNYDDWLKIFLSLENRFIKVAKLIAWDLAIDKNGVPVLIEINLPYSGIDLLQIANGPLSGDKTEQIIGEVMSDKKKYNGQSLAY